MLNNLSDIKSENINGTTFIKIGKLLYSNINNNDINGQEITIAYPNWFSQLVAENVHPVKNVYGAGSLVSSSGANCEVIAFRTFMKLYPSSKSSDNYSGSVFFNL